MFMGVSGLSRLIPIVTAACLFPRMLLADAYLSEDDILYSADAYRVNYQDKVIHALGNARFRRGPLTVRAERVVIHYAPDQKIAYLYENVRVHHRERGITVSGSYGELRYLEQYALVTGDALYDDGKRTIASRRIESENWEVHRFTGSVIYRDPRVIIQSGSLVIDGSGDPEAAALFQEVSGVSFLESGDRLYCSSITYFQESGNIEFTGEVLFRQGDAGERSGAVGEPSGGVGSQESFPGGGTPLVVQARVMRYHPGSGTLMCVGDVHAFSGEVSVHAPVARYHREDEVVWATGGVTIRRGGNQVSGNAGRLELRTGTVELQDAVEGSFGLTEGEGILP